MLESLYYLIKLLPQASNFIKKGSLSESFSYKFCAMLKNIFFYRTSPVATSESSVIEPQLPLKLV